MARPVLSIENAKLIYRNFQGRATDLTPEGKRTVCIILDKDVAEQLTADGWNVRFKKDATDPQDEGFYFISVNVAYNNYPPRITMVTRTGKVALSEDTVAMLDVADIESVDVTISPSKWEINKRTGVKGYIKTMWVTITEDPFEKKYSGVPDSGQSPLDGD